MMKSNAIQFDAKRNKVINLDVEIEMREAEKKALLIGLQKDCEHEKILESAYEPGAHRNADVKPPCRICFICGKEEVGARHHGGGVRYTILTGTPFRVVQQDEFYRHKKLQPLAKVEVPEDPTMGLIRKTLRTVAIM